MKFVETIKNIFKIEELRKEAEKPRLKVPDSKPAYDLQETARNKRMLLCALS